MCALASPFVTDVKSHPHPATHPALPDYLSGTEAHGLLSEGQPVAQFQLGDYKNFVYLIIDWFAREAALVDSRKEIEPIAHALSKHGLKLTKLLLTHTHWDHVHGIAEAKALAPGAPIFVHELDRGRLRDSDEQVRLVSDGETIALGTTEIEVMHTPGHSAGEVSYRLAARDGHPPFLFTGDTLFVRECGRTDLPTGNNEEMFRSLSRIKALDPATVILPGHQYAREAASNLSRELVESPPLLCQTEAELAALP